MASSPVAPPTQAGSPPPRRRVPAAAYLAAGVAVILVAALVSYVLIQGRQRSQAQALRPWGIPASVSDSLVSLMGLSALPGPAAPGFTLTDQAGRTVSLAGLRGRAVVLEFMDPHCTDICPIVSAAFVDAYRDLGAVAARVVFMATFSREHGLDAIPDWHFVTGPLAALRASWAGYHIAVEAAGPNADVQHSSVIYFIDPSGHERFLATPGDDHTASGTAYLPAAQLTEWGHGIALLARQVAG